MQVKEIMYGETVNINDGWYKAHATADVYPNETVEEAYSALMAKVKGIIAEGAGAATEEAPAKPAPAPKKKVAKKPAPKKVEAEVVEEEAEEEVKAPVKKKSPAKKAGNKRPVAYDRTVQAHKKAFAGVLKELLGADWHKSEETKQLAGSVSTDLNGTPMFDGNTGNVLESFADVVKEKMSSEEDGL